MKKENKKMASEEYLKRKRAYIIEHRRKTIKQ